MIDTIEKAKENYISILRDYVTWTETTKKANGGSNFMLWDEQDYRKALSLNEGFKLIEKVLDLTQAEIAEIEHQAGIKNATTPTPEDEHLSYVLETNQPNDPD